MSAATVEELERLSGIGGQERFEPVADTVRARRRLRDARRQDSPLLPLLPLLPQGGDIGFHLVLARGAGGAGRMSMDPVIRRLQESNSPDVVLSCPPGDGPLLGGAKPRRLPPGRALLCTRRGSSLLQTGECTPG